MPQRTDDILDTGKQIVDDFTRIIIKNVVDGIVLFIRSTDLTMEEWQRISDALAMKVRPMPIVLLREFIDETGLDLEFDRLNEAYHAFMESRQSFAEWWAENQGKYV